MSNWFNHFLVSILSLFPKWLIGLVARKYVAGTTIAQAVEQIKSLQAEQFLASLDVLGEHVKTEGQAQDAADQYLQLSDALNREGLNCNISLKLSQMGIELDARIAWRHLENVLAKARENGNFVRIDMEDSALTDITLEFYKRARQQFDNVGMVLQAYLYRSATDLNQLMDIHPNIRICKGIYKEAPEMTYQNDQDIRDNFLRLVKYLLDNGGYAAIATHDTYLIDRCEQYIVQNNITADRYEFQVLFGVPVKEVMHRLVGAGHRVRYYLPFGVEWYPYSMRRLKENPDIAGYIFKDFFKFTRR